METQRSSAMMRRAGSGAHEIVEAMDNDALSIAAAEKTLGRPLDPEEIARLKAVNSMLKDRSKLAALLSGERATKPAALPESVESPDHDILDFLHLPDTIPVRSMIMLMAEGIPEAEVDRLLTSSRYGQLKTAFMETTRNNGKNWIRNLDDQYCYRTKVFLLWNFARLCTAEIIGLRDRTLKDMSHVYAGSVTGFYEAHVGEVFGEKGNDRLRYQEIKSPLDWKKSKVEDMDGPLGAHLTDHFNVNAALHHLGLTKGNEAWNKRLSAGSSKIESTLLSSLNPLRNSVMAPPVLAEEDKIVDFDHALYALQKPWLSDQDRKLLADEPISVDLNLLPDGMKRLQSDEGIPVVEVYAQLARHFAQKGALYEWIHAVVRKMPGDNEKHKIATICDTLERQMVVLKLLMINADKLRIDEGCKPGVAEAALANAFAKPHHGFPTFSESLLKTGCEVVDGLIVPHEETNGVKATVVEVMTAWKKGNVIEKEKQNAAVRAKVADGERLAAEKSREDQELDRLISECEAAHEKIDEMIRGPLAKGLANLVIALQDTDEAKRIFRGCGEAALSDLKQDLEYAEDKHWIAKRFDSSTATKKISRLKTQLTLLTSLWEDETCHFETASVEPLVHSENRVNMKAAVDAAAVVAATRTIAKSKRLEFTGDTLHTFRQLMTDFVTAYRALHQQIEAMKSKREGDNSFQTKVVAVNKKTENVVLLSNKVDVKSDLTDVIAKLIDQRRVGFTAGFEEVFKEAVPNEADRWRNSLNARRGMSTSSTQIVLELCKDADKI